jgi:xanthine dehydrogenase accessory factor
MTSGEMRSGEGGGLAGRVDALRRERTAFVRATVVRAQQPSSAHPGDAAIVHADGSIEGFVGGQCAEGSVRTAALRALRDGETVLLRVLPNGDSPFPETPGAHVVINPCLSGGALEIFLEPLLPPARITVIGRGPIAVAIAELGPPLGYLVDLADDARPAAGSLAVVVATLGGDEVGAIRAALDAGAPYVGLVASPRRGAAVLAELQLTDAERLRIRTPVGLDIGARNAPEIALSILAEIVKARRLDGLERLDRFDRPPPAPAPAIEHGCHR